MSDVREPPVPGVQGIDDERLMLYLDGELPRDEAREVERLLEATPAARQRRDALAQLREIFVARIEAAEDDAEPRLEAMWDKLRAELPARTPARARPGVWAAAREWLETWRGHVMTGAVAAAAGALVATMLGGDGAQPNPGPATRPAIAAEVESLEVPDGSAMVFQIPGEPGDAPTTVIWLSEELDSTQGEGPI